jgi:hypothetical protein
MQGPQFNILLLIIIANIKMSLWIWWLLISINCLDFLDQTSTIIQIFTTT